MGFSAFESVESVGSSVGGIGEGGVEVLWLWLWKGHRAARSMHCLD